MDLSYSDALELVEPHVVLLGPAPCQGCGAWVEWAGVDWLALGTTERHDCGPYLEGQRARYMAHPQLWVVPAPAAPRAARRWLAYGLAWVALFVLAAWVVAQWALANSL